LGKTRETLMTRHPKPGSGHFNKDMVLRRMRQRRAARDGGRRHAGTDRLLNALIIFAIFLLLGLVVLISAWLFG
jgi:hypothetical protein